MHHPRGRAGASAGMRVLSRMNMRVVMDGLDPLRLRFDGDGSKRVGRTLFDGNRAEGALAQARAQPVAEILRHKPRLAVDDANRAFGTTGHAGPAAGAFLFVDLHNLSRCVLHDRVLDCLSMTLLSHNSFKPALTWVKTALFKEYFSFERYKDLYCNVLQMNYFSFTLANRSPVNVLYP
jgi:hypothetical protein